MSFRDGRKPNFVGCSVGIGSGRVNRSGVHQHDRDVVLNGVHTAAFAAFQTLPVRIQDHRLLANRADQHVKQILRNHSGFIVAQSGVAVPEIAIPDPEQHPPRRHRDTEESFFIGSLSSRSCFIRDEIMNSLFSVIPCLRGEVLVCERPGDRSAKVNLGHYPSAGIAMR